MHTALKALVAGFALTAAVAAPASADPCPSGSSATATITVCTATLDGSCAHPGDRCRRAQWHKTGWTKADKRIVCKGNHAHPRWRRP